ncbi:MAG: phage GP46 family protein [Rhizobiales bacterium]|nr:phage GP46 family protein [Hyphomicrobiales bacterium]
MPDIRIVSSATLAETVADWLLLADGTLDETEELANYARVALMTDATAAPTDVLPNPDSDDRRGWWGDMDAQAIWNGWPIGCKNWLLSRAKITDPNAAEGDTVVRAQTYTQAALTPLINIGMCSAIDVYAYRASDVDNAARIDQINVLARIYRGPLPEIDLLFQDLWQDMMITPIRDQWGYRGTPQLLPPYIPPSGILTPLSRRAR